MVKEVLACKNCPVTGNLTKNLTLIAESWERCQRYAVEYSGWIVLFWSCSPSLVSCFTFIPGAVFLSMYPRERTITILKLLFWGFGFLSISIGLHTFQNLFFSTSLRIIPSSHCFYPVRYYWSTVLHAFQTLYFSSYDVWIRGSVLLPRTPEVYACNIRSFFPLLQANMASPSLLFLLLAIIQNVTAVPLTFPATCELSPCTPDRHSLILPFFSLWRGLCDRNI